jgi:hypothetical protein
MAVMHHVDPAALRAAALRLDDAADIAGTALDRHLGGLRFDADAAGRGHAAAGAALRGGVEALAADLDRWARTCRGLAAALREAAERYRAADDVAADALR